MYYTTIFPELRRTILVASRELRSGFIQSRVVEREYVNCQTFIDIEKLS